MERSVDSIDLFSPVTALKGVGPARARQLEKLGIFTLYDLIAFFPRGYEDRTKRVAIAALEPDVPACFEAMVISQPTTAYVRRGMELTRVRVADETGQLTLSWFNQSYRKNQLVYGESYIFYGAVRADHPGQMANPSFESADSAGQVTGRLVPIYPLTAGITSRVLAACIAQALDACRSELPDILPESVRQQYHLCPAPMAYEMIHRPLDAELLNEARRRLVFEEFFVFSAGLALLRSRQTRGEAEPCRTDCMSPFDAALPFRLTGAQQHAIDDILHDLASGVPMNRLVQGDVGSGKTMVAAAAAFCVIQNGHQAAFMAPTEILAEQHAATLSRLLAPLGVSIALLTGSMTTAQRRPVLAGLADGRIQLIVGTHALFSEKTVFHDLGLVIADEQHRFGVAQRARLAAKGHSPHLLVMSATPIPRTLALLAYGDLNVSVLDELPPGRSPVETFLVGESMRQRIHAFTRKQCAAGHQVYIVCPAVEETDDDSLKSAEAWAEALRTTVFPDLRVGLLHGKMKGTEKEAALAAFARHETDILVCTTVVEVGVDVPNATLMVIENADRFGLAQLHQLRGRVGRGDAQSYCVLFSSNRNPETQARLKALCATNDGFKIAETDLAQRGPGDFLGNRQHGLPLFKMASLQMDLQTLQDAQRAAANCITSAEALDAPEFAPLRTRIDALFAHQDMALN